MKYLQNKKILYPLLFALAFTSLILCFAFGCKTNFLKAYDNVNNLHYNPSYDKSFNNGGGPEQLHIVIPTLENLTINYYCVNGNANLFNLVSYLCNSYYSIGNYINPNNESMNKYARFFCLYYIFGGKICYLYLSDVSEPVWDNVGRGKPFSNTLYLSTNKDFFNELCNRNQTDLCYKLFYEDAYNIGYDLGYNDGNDDGYSEGIENGYNSGKTDGLEQGEEIGYNKGYNEGFSLGQLNPTVENVSFQTLFASVAQVPITILGGLFSFELFGMNVLAILCSILSGLLIIYVIKKFI